MLWFPPRGALDIRSIGWRAVIVRALRLLAERGSLAMKSNGDN